MSSDYVSIIDNAYLQLEAVYTGNSDYAYNSGTIYAKQQFTVEQGGGLDFKSHFVAPVVKGTWPAFWLTGVNSWPPEIDIAEWKGDGKISFNTFNTSSEVAAYDYTYPSPTTAWRVVTAELRDENGSDVSIKFYLDGTLITTQYGEGMVGEPFYLIVDLQMEGSSGSPGPTSGKCSGRLRRIDANTFLQIPTISFKTWTSSATILDIARITLLDTINKILSISRLHVHTSQTNCTYHSQKRPCHAVPSIIF